MKNVNILKTSSANILTCGIVGLLCACSQPAPDTASNKPAASPVVKSVGNNLVINGDFTEGPPTEISGWSWWKEHAISRDSDDQVANSLKVDCKPGQKITFKQSIDMVLVPGKKYLVSGKVKASAATGSITLEVAREGGASIVETKPVASTEWTTVETTFTAPLDCTNMILLLKYRPDPKAEPAPITVWYANIKMFATES